MLIFFQDILPINSILLLLLLSSALINLCPLLKSVCLLFVNNAHLNVFQITYRPSVYITKELLCHLVVRLMKEQIHPQGTIIISSGSLVVIIYFNKVDHY